MTIHEALNIARPLAPLDRELLLAAALEKKREFVLAHPEYPLSSVQARLFQKWVVRRHKKEPLAYLLGTKEFFGRSFLVSEATLIPRPETEILVEKVLSDAALAQPADIVDVGTGSGNIILTLALEIRNQRHLRYFGLDLSGSALKMARRNRRRHHLEKKVSFIKGDLLSGYHSHARKERLVIVTANLPYVSERLYAQTAPEVRDYEPKSALVSSQRGLGHILRLLDELGKLEKVHAYLEISPEQAFSLQKTVGARLPGASKAIHTDLAGRARILEIRF